VRRIGKGKGTWRARFMEQCRRIGREKALGEESLGRSAPAPTPLPSA